MTPNQAEIVRREQMSIELEQTLRAIDILPVAERMARIREIAARPLQKTFAAVEALPLPVKKTPTNEHDPKSLIQLSRLCRRFRLSQHTSAVLSNFVDARLSKRSRLRFGASGSAGRLSPLQEVVWNVAPFFRHSARTDAARSGHISWQDLVQFLSLVQHTQKRTLHRGGFMRIVNRTSRLRNEVNRLRVIYQRIRDEAPDTPYAAQIQHLLGRHTY
jgi:hypothetical protein